MMCFMLGKFFCTEDIVLIFIYDRFLCVCIKSASNDRQRYLVYKQSRHVVYIMTNAVELKVSFK